MRRATGSPFHNLELETAENVCTFVVSGLHERFFIFGLKSDQVYK